MIRNILKHFSLFVLFNSLNEQLTNNINNNNSNKKKNKTASFPNKREKSSYIYISHVLNRFFFFLYLFLLMKSQVKPNIFVDTIKM